MAVGLAVLIVPLFDLFVAFTVQPVLPHDIGIAVRVFIYVVFITQVYIAGVLFIINSLKINMVYNLTGLRHQI